VSQRKAASGRHSPVQCRIKRLLSISARARGGGGGGGWGDTIEREEKQHLIVLLSSKTLQIARAMIFPSPIVDCPAEREEKRKKRRKIFHRRRCDLEEKKRGGKTGISELRSPGKVYESPRSAGNKVPLSKVPRRKRRRGEERGEFLPFVAAHRKKKRLGTNSRVSSRD